MRSAIASTRADQTDTHLVILCMQIDLLSHLMPSASAMDVATDFCFVFFLHCRCLIVVHAFIWLRILKWQLINFPFDLNPNTFAYAASFSPAF